MSAPRSPRTQPLFKRDFFRLLSGTSLAQIISLASGPILTRIFAPEAFGLAAMFASIVGVLGVIACLSYELAIVLPDREDEAVNLLGACLVFNLLTTLLVAVTVGYFGHSIVRLLGTPALLEYFWVVPFAVFVQGSYSALNYWNTRTKQFTRLGVARVSSQVFGTSTSVGLGIAGLSTGWTLIASSLIGQLVATATLASQVAVQDGKRFLRALKPLEMWRMVKEHRNFPLFSAPGAVLNSASWQVPVLLLGVLFSPAIAGIYSLGFRLIQMPMSLIGGAISQVFFQRGAEAYRAGKLGPLVEILYRKMVAAALIPTLVIALVGGDLFALIFGTEWREAGVYTQILAPWAFIWFLSSPLSTIYYIQNRQKEDLFIQFGNLGVRVSAIIIGGALGTPIIAMALLSAGGLVVYGYVLMSILGYSGMRIRVALAILTRECLIALGFLLPVFATKLLLDADPHAVLAVSGVTLFVYFYLGRRAIGWI